MFKKLRKIVERQILNFENVCATFVGTVCTQKDALLGCVREGGHLELFPLYNPVLKERNPQKKGKKKKLKSVHTPFVGYYSQGCMSRNFPGCFLLGEHFRAVLRLGIYVYMSGSI